VSKFFIAALIIVWPCYTVIAEPASLDAFLVRGIVQLVKLPESAAKEFVGNILKYSEAYNLDPYLVTAIIAVESRFRHFRSEHDFGPMQVNRFWFDKLDVDESDLLQIEGGIKTGTQILAINYQEQSGDIC
jgi:soluble lytic murein transglycosylase-like protein